MASSRIDDLRRRVEADPASIAFAQLAEEYRRSGQTDEAVRVCREGLTRHPGYLSARVTLGRALLDLGKLDEARIELDFVATEAPENLAAVRGLAEICHREGELSQALEYYQRALALARHDPELEEIVQQLSRQVGAEAGPSNGLSFEEAHQELLTAADRMPPQPASDVHEASETAGSTAPFDFDKLVAALGTPSAPSQLESVEAEVVSLPTLEELLPLSDGGDPFAALEAELREHVQEPSGAPPSDEPEAGAVPAPAAEPEPQFEAASVPEVQEIAAIEPVPPWSPLAGLPPAALDEERPGDPAPDGPVEAVPDRDTAEIASNHGPATDDEPTDRVVPWSPSGRLPESMPMPESPLDAEPDREVEAARSTPWSADESAPARPDVAEPVAVDPAHAELASGGAQAGSEAETAPAPRAAGDDVLDDLEDWLSTLQDRSGD